jgi:aspartate kinase
VRQRGGRRSEPAAPAPGGDRPGLKVQKYGVSVGDIAGMRRVCRRIKSAVDGGWRVVAAIAALGQDTDRLVERAIRMKGAMARPSPRELDMLMASGGEGSTAPLVAIGLQGIGVPAMAFTGLQAGIETNAVHGSAEITCVRPDRVLLALERGSVAVVAGFQGATADLDVTTLGRYGGDATAVWLAAALRADVCEIYTNVPGILTADRHVVPEATVLRHISYEEAMELGSAGLPASQPRAVEIAEKFAVPMHFRPVATLDAGTMVVGHVPEHERMAVCAVAHQDRVAKVRVAGVPNRPGAGADLFEPLRQHGISVDAIAHIAEGDLTIMVHEPDLERIIGVIEPAATWLGASVTHDCDLAKISVVGKGMQGRAGVAARMFRTLADVGVNIDSIATSEIRITCIVRRNRHEQAVRALHAAFGLGRTAG